MNRIAVLMTCYNRVGVTLRCLECLFQQVLPKGYELKVFLVDDASPDGTGRKVKEKFPQVNIVQSNGGLFWCKGMRLAWDVAASKGNFDFYLWLNDDVVLKQGALAGLIEDWERTKGVVVGTFSSDEGECEVSYGATRKMPDGTPRIADAGMNGNLVLVPREVYERVGPICGTYHHQYGDYDYGWLLRRNGLEFYASSRFCGVCPQQPERYLHLKGRSLVNRLKLLFDPKGYSLHDALLYSYRNKGVCRMMLSLAHIGIKVVFALE